jgi:hypothetical protein
MMDLFGIDCMGVSSFFKRARSNSDLFFLLHDSCELHERSILVAEAKASAFPLHPMYRARAGGVDA